MNIYVGNLSFDATDEDLREAFEQHGRVESAKIVMDSYSGRSRGFGFVEMPDASEARAAISGLDGQDFMGERCEWMKLVRVGRAEVDAVAATIDTMMILGRCCFE